VNEPAFDTTHSPFCIWRRTSDDRWSSSAVQLPPGDDPDGSAWLLSILAGEPRQYVQFAADYFEREIDVSDVARVYRHVPLTQALVKRLNPDVDVEALMEDITEIGYPETI
jgi:hypothetical protein